MTTGQRIARKRKEAGLSQEALGAELGVSRQSIYKWESDAALPEIDKLVALSRRFGVTVGWLLGVEEAPETPPAPDSGELTDAQLKMVEEITERYIAALPELADALEALPEKLRLPLTLHYLEGFSVEEIARILRIPAGTVKSRLHQARSQLRVQWLETEGDETASRPPYGRSWKGAEK